MSPWWSASEREREREVQTAVFTSLCQFLCENRSCTQKVLSTLLMLQSPVSGLVNKCILWFWNSSLRACANKAFLSRLHKWILANKLLRAPSVTSSWRWGPNLRPWFSAFLLGTNFALTHLSSKKQTLKHKNKQFRSRLRPRDEAETRACPELWQLHRSKREHICCVRHASKI